MLERLIIPHKLHSRDKVAAITLSWGGPQKFPLKYQRGKKQLEDTFNLEIVETPNCLKHDNLLHDNPQLRLDDLRWAFSNPEIKGIFSTIGGADSIRLLNYLSQEDYDLIKKNPKPFVGMSDSTVTHFICLKSGIRTYYGPSVMFGFGENNGIHEYTKNSVSNTLFECTHGEIDWNSTIVMLDNDNWNQTNISRYGYQNTPWRFIQGDGKFEGRLIGGNLDVIMSMILGTDLFPSLEFFNESILFLECTDIDRGLEFLPYWLRNLGAQGILNKIHGILYAKPGVEIDHAKGDRNEEYTNYIRKSLLHDEIILNICKEFSITNIPIVTNMDFGHVVPQHLVPYGAMVTIDSNKRQIFINH